MGIGGDSCIDEEYPSHIICLQKKFQNMMRRQAGQWGAKDGTGANSDVIFESKVKFEFFGNSVQIHIRTAYCMYACYLAFS